MAVVGRALESLPQFFEWDESTVARRSLWRGLEPITELVVDGFLKTICHAIANRFDVRVDRLLSLFRSVNRPFSRVCGGVVSESLVE